MKQIYDVTGDQIGTYHFMKNKNMYSLRFNDKTYQANIMLSIDALPEYLKQFNLKTEQEVDNIGN
ncbi:hypothetical protein [Salinicoccus albus]|uniref:hypothetical protein n=1 Tax=Salinicoccus albus TaxID=418756 RepID=UPI0003669336|nr:hypothetical protein [Salinicoccus albus]